MPKSQRRSQRHPRVPARVEQAQRPLIQRLLDAPQLALAVPRLQPELLHQIIQRCGLEDSGELLALATPEQLVRVFDLDVWRRPAAGTAEQFDGDRFGVWLEVLVELGGTMAAQKLSQMDAGLVAAGLAHHVRIFDRGAAHPYFTLDGEEMHPMLDQEDDLACDIGGQRIVAQRTQSWDAIVAVLMSLHADHPAYFGELIDE